MPEEAALFQLAAEIAVAVLHPAARVGVRCDLRVEAPVRSNRTQQRQLGIVSLLAAQELEVDLTKRGRDVDDASSSVECHEVRGDDTPEVERRLVALEPIERWDVSPAYEFFAAKCSLDGEIAACLLSQGGQEFLRDDQPPVAVDDHRVIDTRLHGHQRVGRQRPGRRRPDQQRRLRVVPQRKAHEDRGIVNGPVTLADFGCRQNGSALRPPPDHLVTLVEQILLEQLGQRPPNALDITLVVGHVGVFDVEPEGELVGDLCPLFCV